MRSIRDLFRCIIPRFPRRAFIEAAGLIAALLVSGVVYAQPVFPSVWYYRDSFNGDTAIDKIAPESVGEKKARGAERQVIPIGKIATLHLVVPADKPAPLIEFAGQLYPLREEGLYRFLRRPEDRATPADSGIRNLIFVHSPDSTVPFLRGISRLTAHGNRDDHTPTADLHALLSVRPWIILTCGPARDLLAATLGALSPTYQMRRVDTIVLAGTENGYDDGHSMLEVRGGAFASWTLVDIDQGLLFRATDDLFLDTTSLISALEKDAPIRYETLSPKELDLQFTGRSPATQAYNFAVYGQQIARYPQARAAWYRRVLTQPRYRPLGKN